MDRYEWSKYLYGDIPVKQKMKINIKFKKPDNNAPKSIRGDYDLSIHGNKIVLVDNVDGTTVEAKCHPDDDFDIGIGITEAFKKLNVKREEIRKQKEEEEKKKIKVGDWVEVLYDAIVNPYCEDFFKKNNLMHYAPRFCYGYIPEKGITGKVIFVNQYYILVETKDENGKNPIFLVDNYMPWLRKVANPDA